MNRSKILVSGAIAAAIGAVLYFGVVKSSVEPQDTFGTIAPAERYHAPSDDVNQPVNQQAAIGFVNVVHRLAVRIANRNSRPKWNDTSFFRRFAP